MNPSRTKLLQVISRMGGRIAASVSSDGSWEPRGTIIVEAAPLQATVVTPEEAPGLIDELPILMVAAACAQGTSRLQGIGELRVKETDRIQSMVNGLQQLGVRARLPVPDTVVIEGGPMEGGVVDSAGDHRTAMSLAVAGLRAEGRTTIRGADCVAKSFPGFFEQPRSIAVPRR